MLPLLSKRHPTNRGSVGGPELSIRTAPPLSVAAATRYPEQGGSGIAILRSEPGAHVEIVSGGRRTPTSPSGSNERLQIGLFAVGFDQDVDTAAVLESIRLRTGGRELRVVAVDPESLDVDTFASYLPSSSLPPLDLLVRTSGEHRISNFFLWEAAYAELHFSNVLWPEFGEAQLIAALEDYASRERRFGRTSAQVADAAEG